MPADPELLDAIYKFGENIRNSVDAKLLLYKEDADRGRRAIHDRLEVHSKESREQQAENTAKLQGAIVLLGTQVTDLSARFGAHEKADAKEFERVDAAIKDNADKRHGYFQAFVASVFTAIAGWFVWVVKGVEK